MKAEQANLEHDRMMEAGAALQARVIELENQRDALTGTLAEGTGVSTEIVSLQSANTELSRKLKSANDQSKVADATILARDAQIRQLLIEATSATTTNRRLRDERDKLTNDLQKSNTDLIEATVLITNMRTQFATHTATIAT